EATRLGAILDELLELATASHVAAHVVAVDVAELVRDRVEAWRPLADQRGVQVPAPAGAPAHALVDPVLVCSALDAVLDNAVKFSPEGGEVTVNLSTE